MDKIPDISGAARAWWLMLPAAAALIGCGSLDSSKTSAPRTNLLDLRITEVHYHPADEDGLPGEDFEFIEIKNTGSASVSLDEVAFTDGIDFAFPSGAKLEAGGFLVVASDSASFESRYGFAPFGSYAGQLKNEGEEVDLRDMAADSKIASVEFSNQGPWPAQADGGGFSLVPVTTDPGLSGLSGIWRSSFEIHGSPGKDDPSVAMVSEVSSHTDPPDQDAVELFNPNSSPLDVGGWCLSDSRTSLAKFRIPSGTLIPAKGFVVFDEDDFNPPSDSAGGFSLSAHGDEIWLSADSTGCRESYCHGFAFGEIENGTTFGRFVAESGEEHFVAQTKPTLGTENAGPWIGPVIISEVMYQPVDDRNEYLELANVAGKAVPLFDKDNPANTWKVSGLGFQFPTGVTLEAGEAVLVISDTVDESAFRSVYKVSGSVRIFKKSGNLSNQSDTLELLMPQEPYLDSSSGTPVLKVPYKTVEKLAYSDNSPWPGGADSTGKALTRIDADAYANDPGNWKASPPSPGKTD